jgi:HAD superfamily hydrolase (TIGR01509 family)
VRVILAERVLSMEYRCVVFDFFGVISSEVAKYWLARYFPPARAVAIKDALFPAADRGEVSQDELFDELAALAQISPERFRSEFHSHVMIDPDMVALIRRLRGRVRLGLLTNAMAPFVRGIMAEHRLEPLFDEILVSAEHRLAKPDPAIFRAMLAMLDVAAADAVMVDDNADNVAAAKAVGMQTVLCTSCEQVARELGV